MAKHWVLVGSIGKPYGLKGKVKVNSYTEPTRNILLYRPWYLAAPNQASPSYAIEIVDYRFHHLSLIVQFEHYPTPESVRSLIHHNIYVERQKLSPLANGEYYWTDLEGLKVYTYQHIYLGTIQSIFATGSNDVLVVKGQKKYLIPYLLDKTIKFIDLNQQTMTVDWDPNF